MTEQYRRKALIVEDDEVLRTVVSSIVKGMDIDVVEAADGKSALQCVKKNTFDLILSDIQMPHMNGFDLLTQLRVQDVNTPVVFLTAMNDRGPMMEALRLGAFDFVVKPFNVSEVEQILQRAIEVGVRRRRLEGMLKGEIEGATPEKISHEKKMISLLHVVNNVRDKKNTKTKKKKAG